MLRFIPFLALVVVGACKQKAGGGSEKDVAVVLTTPADVGRTFCALIEAGQTDRLSDLSPWDAQVKGCNASTRFTKCGGVKSLQFGTCKIPQDTTYPECTEQRVRDDWKSFADTFHSSHASCRVERPESGRLEEVDMVIFGKRDTLRLTKNSSGKWTVADSVMLPEIQLAALDAKMQQASDKESGFGK